MRAASAHGGRFAPSLPVVLTLEEVKRENDEMVTLFFPRPAPCEAAGQGLDLDAFQPGQFFMIWLPRCDEKPYTIGYLDRRRVGVTVQRRGPFSTRLFELQPGAQVGIRGPFGRGFLDTARWEGSPRAALIGGGCGMAVLAPLVEQMPRATVVQGARSANVLLYLDRFRQQVAFTDDGSGGRKGFPTEWLEEQARSQALDIVFTCGPEAMMAAVAAVCRRAGIQCQVAMERYMKCGLGVCGQCECDGQRVCVEGPVFTLDELAAMLSFGQTRRDKTGRRIPVVVADQCPAGPVAPRGCDEAGR